MAITRRSLLGTTVAGVFAGNTNAENPREEPLLTQGLFATRTSQNRLGGDLMRSFERAARLTAPDAAILMLTPSDFTTTNVGVSQSHHLNPQARSLERMIQVINAPSVTVMHRSIEEGVNASFVASRLQGENIINSYIRERACAIFITLSDSFNYGMQTPESNMTIRDNILRSFFGVQDPYYLRQIRMPGNYRDAVAWTGYHEIDHCRPQGQGPYHEDQSDAFANMFFFRDHQRLGLDPEFVYFRRSVRAFKYMLGLETSSHYSTNSLSPLPGERWLTNNELERAQNEIARVRGIVLLRALSDSGALINPVNKVAAFSRQANLQNDLQTYHVSDSEMQAVMPIVNNNDLAGAIRWLERNPPPREIQQAAWANLVERAEFSLRNISSAIGGEHIFPQRMYQAAVSLLRERAFDNQPFGKLFVERFVDGARRYAPELFAVPPHDRLGPPDLSAALRATPVFRAPDDPNQVNAPAAPRRP
jgi:hypothetical protein